VEITRQYPEKVGVEDFPYSGVGEQLFWPLQRSPEEK
jgi:hypothetical protein